MLRRIVTCCWSIWSAVTVDILRPGRRGKNCKIKEFLSTWISLFFCSFVSDVIPTQSILSLEVFEFQDITKRKKKSSLPTPCSICHVLVEGAVDPYNGVINAHFSWNQKFLSFNVILNKNIYHHAKNNKYAWQGYSMEQCTQTSHNHQPNVHWRRKSKLEKQKVQRLFIYEKQVR